MEGKIIAGVDRAKFLKGIELNERRKEEEMEFPKSGVALLKKRILAKKLGVT